MYGTPTTPTPAVERFPADRIRPFLRALLPTLLLAGSIAPGSLVAQESAERPRGPAVMTLPVSVSAQGSGNAFHLSGRVPDAIFYNPALVASAGGMSGGFHRFGDGATLVAFSGATEWWGSGVGIGIRTLGYGLEAPGGGLPGGTARSETELLGGGDVGASEIAASLALGRSLFGVTLGIGGTLIEQRISGESRTTGALDIGATHGLGPVTAWLSVQSVGPALGSSEGEDMRLPHRFTLGASTPRRLPVGPLDLGAAAAIVHLAEGRTALNAGGEIAWWPVAGRTLLFRIGHHGESSGGRPLTLGGGFTGDRISLDYAHQGFGAAGRVHRFGIGWR